MPHTASGIPDAAGALVPAALQLKNLISSDG